MALDFPNSPTTGDEFTGGGFTWVWTGTTWSKIAASTAGTANDFALLVGATGNTTYILDRTYTSGRYTIEFTNGDTTYDIYAIAEDGTYAGYTNGDVIEVSADFTEIVVLGAATAETVLFTYQGTLTSPSSAGDVATAGAFISSVVTSSLPDIDDTTVVNGGNFASDVEVSFIDQSAVEIPAKAVVRSSSTQLVVTRPDSFSPDDSPYTVKVVNPGIPVPAGTNAHLLTNAVTAGTNPVWVTGTDIYYNVGGSTSITLLATDTEASDIDYSLVSGTLPDGLTLDGETGVISGTATGAPSEGTVTAITIRAVDTGGNFLDKAFNLTANTAPTWTTAAGALNPTPAPDTAYSFQLEASTGTAGGSLTYSLQAGSLLPGHTLSSTGLISGTSTGVIDDTATFTIRVTDEGGLFLDREFTLKINGNPYIALANPTPAEFLADIDEENILMTMYAQNSNINISDFDSTGYDTVGPTARTAENLIPNVETSNSMNGSYGFIRTDSTDWSQPHFLGVYGKELNGSGQVRRIFGLQIDSGTPSTWYEYIGINPATSGDMSTVTMDTAPIYQISGAVFDQNANAQYSFTNLNFVWSTASYTKRRNNNGLAGFDPTDNRIQLTTTGDNSVALDDGGFYVSSNPDSTLVFDANNGTYPEGLTKFDPTNVGAGSVAEGQNNIYGFFNNNSNDVSSEVYENENMATFDPAVTPPEFENNWEYVFAVLYKI